MTETTCVVETEGLTRRYGSFVAVDNLTLRVPRGSIFGFLGPNGAGKSTTIKMLCGLLKPSAGRAVVNGYDVAQEPETIRQHLGYMSQLFSLYSNLTVRENLEFYGGIYNVPRSQLAERIDQVFDQLDLHSSGGQLTGTLSMGWRQRVALGAAMLHQPPVLFLDEPTSGVDPASRRLIWEILDDLAATGTSIFVTTHVMDEADRCDRLAFIDRSHLIAEGSPAELKEALPGVLYHVEVEELLEALEAARQLSYVADAALFGTALHVRMVADDPGRLERDLQAAGLTTHGIHAVSATLEDVFVALQGSAQKVVQ